MATFQVHNDEKENSSHSRLVAGNKTRNTLGAKDKRPTFAVLGNVVNKTRANQGGKTAFRDIQPSTSQISAKQKSIDENYDAVGVQQKKTNVSTRTNIATSKITQPEKLKVFTVYEDNTKNFEENDENLGTEHKKMFTQLDENVNRSLGAIRDPLKDITKNEPGLETPMSITDGLSSPMSIDKSTISQIDVVGDDDSVNTSDDSILEEKKKELKKAPRNDRERFFEVEEYRMNILDYFREIEKKHRPKPTYMKRQPDINYSMRTILVDWLVEVSEEYRLHTETLFMAVSYIDRFLSLMSVVRAKLQLVGTAAMFIAAKFEEIYPPDVGEFVFITDDTYTKAQVLRMEQIMLKNLGFDLCSPTSFVFINTYAILYSMTDKVKFLATYLSELALLVGDPYLHYLPSQISSASIALARYTIELPMWDDELKNITSYDLMELKEVILLLNQSHNLAKTMQQKAIQEKYKQTKFLEVSKIEPIVLNEENFGKILLEQLELMENSLVDETSASMGIAAASNNESVRKMISSLIF